MSLLSDPHLFFVLLPSMKHSSAAFYQHFTLPSSSVQCQSFSPPCLRPFSMTLSSRPSFVFRFFPSVIHSSAIPFLFPSFDPFLRRISHFSPIHIFDLNLFLIFICFFIYIFQALYILLLFPPRLFLLLFSAFRISFLCSYIRF